MVLSNIRIPTRYRIRSILNSYVIFQFYYQYVGYCYLPAFFSNKYVKLLLLCGPHMGTNIYFLFMTCKLDISLSIEKYKYIAITLMTETSYWSTYITILMKVSCPLSSMKSSVTLSENVTCNKCHYLDRA